MNGVRVIVDVAVKGGAAAGGAACNPVGLIGLAVAAVVIWLVVTTLGMWLIWGPLIAIAVIALAVAAKRCTLWQVHPNPAMAGAKYAVNSRLTAGHPCTRCRAGSEHVTVPSVVVVRHPKHLGRVPLYLCTLCWVSTTTTNYQALTARGGSR